MLKLFSVIFLSAYCSVFHTILIMIQASTLNVAFNSHNKSLLTIMMSSNVSKHACMETHICHRIHVFLFWCKGWSISVLLFCPTQFVEIKGSVFKKFGKNNLFQMSNSGKKFRVIFPWPGNKPGRSTCSLCRKWKIYYMSWFFSSHFAFWWTKREKDTSLQNCTEVRLYKNLFIWLQILSTFCFSIFIPWSCASLSHFLLLYSDGKL